VTRDWWRDGVLYQVYPRSFADSNGDGIGDLAGLIGKLDYLAWLGVDGIWLNPIHPSPNVDWGYDVSDYTGIHPDLGTLDDVDRLVAEAGRRGLRIVLDLVPNHTSDRHPWFRERPDYYVWADEVPNNWTSIFGGCAWQLDAERGRYYLHNFAAAQPDLDWWNPDVRAEFERILRFWFDRGIAGFRIDVAHGLVKDQELRDEPSADQRVFSMNRPDTHEVYRAWRSIADAYEPRRALIGEVYVLDLPAWAAYYGTGTDELDLAFNFMLAHADLDPAQMASIVAMTEELLPRGAWPAWIGSNHDAGRFTTRWCGGDESLARCALLVLLSLRGTPFLYYGDELALADGVVPTDRLLDIATPSRDPCRTPMPWSREGGWRVPWLPLLDTSRNVEDQRSDASSTLHFTRDLIALRRAHEELREGDYVEVSAPRGAWVWRRGEAVVAAVNLGSERVDIAGLGGAIALGTDRRRDGERVDGTLSLGAAEGVILIEVPPPA
jgi:alpha-glucosidase